MARSLTRSPLTRLGIRPASVRSRLIALADAATADEWAAGRSWYAGYQRVAMELGAISGTSASHGAALIAATSPRTRWSANLAMARGVAMGDAHVPGLKRNVATARRALTLADPAEVFRGPKTRAFHANLSGDESAVTLDIWMCRAMGVTPATLARVGVYEALADIVRNLAARYDVTPAQFQAVVWVQIRGAAA